MTGLARVEPAAGAAGGARVRLAPVVVAGALLVLSVLAALVLRDGDLNYDLEYGLSWGRALVGGDLPDYELSGSPTPHPLTTFMTTVAEIVPLIDARAVMHGVAYLSYAGLVLCTALLAAELFSWTAALVAGVVIAISTPVLVNTAVAFQDAMTAALVMLAVLLEVRRPRRGVAPLVALGAAGLIRPEAWGLAAAYWVWMLPGTTWPDRVRLAALAGAAPLIWLASEWVITGDPLYSFTATREGAAAARRTTGIAEAPVKLLENLRHAVGRGAMVGGVLGAAGAAVLLVRPQLVRAGRRIDRRIAVPLATLALLCTAFLILGLSELSLLERYVIGPAALLAVFFGYALTGWRDVAPRTLMVAAAIAAAVLAVEGVRSVRAELTRLDPIMDAVRVEHEVLVDLRSLAGELGPLIERCGTVSVDSYRTRPYLAYALDRQPRDVALAERPDPPPVPAVHVVPASKRARDGFTLLGRDGGALPPPPRGFHPALTNASWTAYVRGC